jgi:hypothetical protein
MNETLHHDQHQVPQTSGLAITSLVLALLGCTGFIGAICGHIALSKIKKSNGAQKGEGIAIAGIVCGYLFGLLSILPIIGMATAIILPAVSKARDRAEETQSIANVRQITAGVILYSDDNNGQLPTSLEDMDEQLGVPFISPFAGEAPLPHYEIIATGTLEKAQGENAIIVRDKYSSRSGNCAVGYADGSARSVQLYELE